MYDDIYHLILRL